MNISQSRYIHYFCKFTKLSTKIYPYTFLYLFLKWTVLTTLAGNSFQKIENLSTEKWTSQPLSAEPFTKCFPLMTKARNAHVCRRILFLKGTNVLFRAEHLGNEITKGSRDCYGSVFPVQHWEQLDAFKIVKKRAASVQLMLHTNPPKIIYKKIYIDI